MKTIPLVPPAPMTTEPDGGAPRPSPAPTTCRRSCRTPARTEELKPGIVEAISTVYDPEIPVNIWELGLIYDVSSTPPASPACA